MARIPEKELRRLKGEVSVERLVEASGIALKKSGKGLLGKCPFHQDDEPSLVVTPAKNLWHCFGCGLGGNPIDWVMKLKGVSFRHAVELLREGLAVEKPLHPLAAENAAKPDFPLESGNVIKPVRQSTTPKLPPPVDFAADGQALLDQVVDYYHQTLKTSPEALAYLESRGLANQEAIDTFKLGYANRTLGLRLPEKNRVAGAEIRTRLQEIGIYRETGHEHFNGSLIIPVFDESGNVAEVYGRKVNDNLRAGTPKHLYLPGPHRGIWNSQALAESKEIILCEALIDALTFWCAGYRNATSCFGVEGFTDEMLETFVRQGIQRVLIAFDRDEGGERGTAKVAERLMAVGIDCFRVRFPSGMDANSFYVAQGKSASESLGKLIRQAGWLGQGKHASLPGTVAKPSSDTPPLAAEAMDSQPETAVFTENPPEPLPASPLPESPPDLPLIVTDNDIRLTLGEYPHRRHYRVRGLAKNLSVEVMKINLVVSADAIGDAENAANQSFHVDTLDLYSAKQRSHYVTQASQETGLDEKVLKADLGRILLALEQLQAGEIDQALKPKPEEPMMPDNDREAALTWLKSPDLLGQIVADFAALGLVGEDTNKLMAYLAAISRKLDNPLAVLVQSSSAAGKSALMDAVLAFVPDEDKIKYSAMTGQSLYYMGETCLKHKILAISEEEGASRASYALKLLQSEGELTIASTGKDPQSGDLTTQAYKVEGPVALLLTTTARDLDEELMNRCLVLSVDEGRDQTRAIHRLQRDKRTLDGLMAKHNKDGITRLHQNAQQLLKPLDVLNPYARFLTFPDQTTRLRRDHEKYLTLIDTIAYLHQHQRAVKTASTGQGGAMLEYIEATLDDIELANRIAHDVLGRSLDELPPQTRRLLKLVDGYINSECQRLGLRRLGFRFSRRQLREAIHWGDTQLKVHLSRLAELEYLTVHRTKTGGFEYELVYDRINDDHSLQFPGLADIDTLKQALRQGSGQAYDLARSGQKPTQPASDRGVVGTQPGGGRDGENAAKPTAMRDSGGVDEAPAKTLSSWHNAKIPSYPNAAPNIANTAAPLAAATGN